MKNYNEHVDDGNDYTLFDADAARPAIIIR